MYASNQIQRGSGTYLNRNGTNIAMLFMCVGSGVHHLEMMLSRSITSDTMLFLPPPCPLLLLHLLSEFRCNTIIEHNKYITELVMMKYNRVSWLMKEWFVHSFILSGKLILGGFSLKV